MNREVELEKNPMYPTSDLDPLLQRSHVDNGGVSLSPPLPVSFSEIRKEDIDNGDNVACCRICLESDFVAGDDELISPCLCKGTQQFVHTSCLDHWRSVKEGFAFSHCTTCKAQFHLRVEPFEDNTWRKMKFRLFVARDVTIVFLAVQTVIAAVGGFAYLMDKHGSFRSSFREVWDCVLTKHPISFYYCIGVVAFLVLVGFFGLIIHCLTGDISEPPQARMAGSPQPQMAESSASEPDSHDCRGFYCVSCDSSSSEFDELCVLLAIVLIILFASLGIFYGIVAATMAFQRIWQRHYHILTKRELTKDFVVEDLHGCYTPPKLDPEHEVRLKMLKLL